MSESKAKTNASRSAKALSRSKTGASVLLLVVLLNLAGGFSAHAIMAGDENALPADSPANRLDTLGAAS